MDQKVFEIILAIIPVVGTLFTIVLTSVLIPFIKSKISKENLDKYKSWAKIAVECAEMLYAATPGSGEQKKEWCIKKLTNILNAKKVVITSEQIEMLIEAAVKEMKIAENAVTMLPESNN